MLDTLIIGAGPAGYSAAMTCRMRDLNCVILSNGEAAGWLHKAANIDNYPGLPAISGATLLASFKAQALALGAEEKIGLVRQIMPMDKSFMVLCGNDVLEARSAILCMGAARPQMLPGEESLLGQGVSYCGTCDGMLYRGKNVAVLSSAQNGVEEAAFLSTLAAKVDFFPMRPLTLPENPAYTVFPEKPRSLERETGAITLTTDKGSHTYDGVFIFRPAVAMSQLLPNLVQEGGFITVDRRMATSVPGVFAAGDCTGQPLQIAKAVGEGNVAAVSCAEFLG